jgi:hypothetical protein
VHNNCSSYDGVDTGQRHLRICNFHLSNTLSISNNVTKITSMSFLISWSTMRQTSRVEVMRKDMLVILVTLLLMLRVLLRWKLQILK